METTSTRKEKFTRNQLCMEFTQKDDIFAQWCAEFFISEYPEHPSQLDNLFPQCYSFELSYHSKINPFVCDESPKSPKPTDRKVVLARHHPFFIWKIGKVVEKKRKNCFGKKGLWFVRKIRYIFFRWKTLSFHVKICCSSHPSQELFMGLEKTLVTLNGSFINW